MLAALPETSAISPLSMMAIASTNHHNLPLRFPLFCVGKYKTNDDTGMKSRRIYCTTRIHAI
jgi:hypothetical protein